VSGETNDIAQSQDKHRFVPHPEGMSDLPPGSRPVPPPDPDATTTSAMPVAQGQGPSTGQATRQAGEAPGKQRLRDRLWSLRAVIGVALASVIVGGVGGAALANVADGDEGRFGLVTTGSGAAGRACRRE